jgi:hypothetical protein
MAREALHTLTLHLRVVKVFLIKVKFSGSKFSISYSDPVIFV